MSIYLDTAAIYAPKKEVIDTVIDVLNNHYFNASSIYEKGLESKRIIENVRIQISNEINCEPEEIIFCGSGSEANALAIDGYLKYKENEYCISSVIEHSSILNNDYVIPRIRCDKDGFFNMEDIKNTYDCLVSLQMANSEIGTIQNIKEITKILHNNNCIVHTDAVAAFGHIKIDVKDLKIDMMSVTSQKIGGILGSAFLYVRKKLIPQMNSIIHGIQEHGLRGSTYNTPAIAGFGKAIELIDYNKEKDIQAKRDYILNKLLSIDGVYLNGTNDMTRRLSNNINIRIENIIIDSQQLLALLDLIDEYMCSAGSACHAGDAKPSYVLMAIGLSDELAKKSIRITLSEDNTYEELEKFYNDFKNIIEQYKE